MPRYDLNDNGGTLNGTNNDMRQRVVEGQASREEVEAFIVELEKERELALAAVDKFSNAAVEANNHLASHVNASADLIRALTRIAGENDRMSRLKQAQEAIDNHERAAGD